MVADLGDGRYLFSLLPSSETAERSFWDLYDSDAGRGAFLKRLTEQVGQPARPIPLKNQPLLVTFGDLSDPASVMRVDPADLAATFGAGFALREITLEVTDEAVTDGVVEGVLDYFWWSKEKRDEYSCAAYKCGRNPLRIELAPGLSDSLIKIDFVSGDFQ